MASKPDGIFPLMALVLVTGLFIATWQGDSIHQQAMAGERRAPQVLVEAQPKSKAIAIIIADQIPEGLQPGEYTVWIDGMPSGKLVIDATQGSTAPETSYMAQERRIVIVPR